MPSPAWSLFRSNGARRYTSWPPQRTAPRVGGSSPASALSSVVLPLPDGPTSMARSPARRRRPTPASAWIPSWRTATSSAPSSTRARPPGSAAPGPGRPRPRDGPAGAPRESRSGGREGDSSVQATPSKRRTLPSAPATYTSERPKATTRTSEGWVGPGVGGGSRVHRPPSYWSSRPLSPTAKASASLTAETERSAAAGRPEGRASGVQAAPSKRRMRGVGPGSSPTASSRVGESACAPSSRVAPAGGSATGASGGLQA